MSQRFTLVYCAIAETLNSVSFQCGIYKCALESQHALHPVSHKCANHCRWNSSRADLRIKTHHDQHRRRGGNKQISNGSLTERQGSCCLEWVTDQKTRILLPRMGHWPKDKDCFASNGSLTERQGFCCLEWVTDRKTRILLPRMGHWPKDKDSVAWMSHWRKDKDSVASNGSLTERQGFCCLEWVTGWKTRILLPRMGHWPKDRDSVASNRSLTERQGSCCLGLGTWTVVSRYSISFEFLAWLARCMSVKQGSFQICV